MESQPTPTHIERLKEPMQDYWQQIRTAKLELPKKEAFKVLLERLFGQDDMARKVMGEMTLGAEQKVAQIILPGKLKTGRADTIYRNVIIEFERDTKPKTLEHAKDQLREYVSGQWNSGQPFNYTLIATDCQHWFVYGIDYEALLALGDSIPVRDVTLHEVNQFSLTETNFTDFYFFLDRYLFRTERIKATLENVEREFGQYSTTFNLALPVLHRHLKPLWGEPELEVAYEQWRSYLNIAYGKFEGTRETYVIHTYLSIFAKLIAWHILNQERFTPADQLQQVLTGAAFRSVQIENFVEDDFYHWPGQTQHFSSILTALRAIQNQLADFDFSRVDEDILKGVYQQLIDIETRHALGEYYTPDWLCQRMVAHVPLREDSRVLDPSCGSGSFLRAAIERFRRDFPDKPAHELADQVVGIDIHPLSVQIAKTTIVMALKDLMNDKRVSIHTRIYLANTIFIPSSSVSGDKNTLFASTVNLTIDAKSRAVKQSLFQDPLLFDECVNLCDSLSADITKNALTRENFTTTFTSRLKRGTPTESDLEEYYFIYESLRIAKLQNRDSIWAFILRNSYRPRILKNQFDLVLGNPPWVEFRYISNALYQDELNKLAIRYNVRPKRQQNFTHLEIAAIFLAHASHYFLRDGGKLGFVLPRGFLSGDQHHNTRAGMGEGFKLTEVWDLKDVSPLFLVPACVAWAEPRPMRDTSYKGKKAKVKPVDNLPGLSFKGRLSANDLEWNQAEDRLTVSEVTWNYAELGTSSSLITGENEDFGGNMSHYKPLFKQGATLVPRTFYFVEPTYIDMVEGESLNFHFDVITTEEAFREAKDPWKARHRGIINGQLLYQTLLSRNILPFTSVGQFPRVHLPYVFEEGKFIPITYETNLYKHGFDDSWKFFEKIEKVWLEKRTENAANKNMNYVDRLDYQRGLINQNPDAEFTVVYNASAKDCNAFLLNKKEGEAKIILDSICYWHNAKTKEEAFFLLGFLNSNIANVIIKDFQARGLFGPRHVSRKILDIPLPEFDPADEDHKALAALGAQAAAKAAQWVQESGVRNLSGRELGRVRTALRNHLADELTAIDEVLRRILGLSETEVS